MSSVQGEAIQGWVVVELNQSNEYRIRKRSAGTVDGKEPEPVGTAKEFEHKHRPVWNKVREHYFHATLGTTYDGRGVSQHFNVEPPITQETVDLYLRQREKESLKDLVAVKAALETFCDTFKLTLESPGLK